MLSNEIKYLRLLKSIITKCILLLLLLIIISSCNNKKDTSRGIYRLAFGSGNHQDSNQGYWNTIYSYHPEIWVWLGDAIEARTDNPSDYGYDLYNYKHQDTLYYWAKDSIANILGIWHNTDYSEEFPNSSNKFKYYLRNKYLDFLEISNKADIRSRSALYTSFEIGENYKQMKVILLDTRFYKDSTGNLIGDKQWKWLRNLLRFSNSRINIICSDIPILNESGNFEKWADFRAEKNKLMELLAEFPYRKCIFLTGNTKYSEISNYQSPNLPYKLYEFCSANLNKEMEESPHSNPLRLGEAITKNNFGLLSFKWKIKMMEINCKFIGTGNQILTDTSIVF